MLLCALIAVSACGSKEETPESPESKEDIPVGFVGANGEFLVVEISGPGINNRTFQQEIAVIER